MMSQLELSSLGAIARQRNILELFKDVNRAEHFSLDAAEVYLDFSKQNITEPELQQLLALAEQRGLSEKIKAMFFGEKINNTEQRAVLHSALRAPLAVQQQILGGVATQVADAEQRMQAIVSDVQQGRLCGVHGDKITDVLAIGIGGSFYGIKIGLSALQPYASTGIKVHVLANVDGEALAEKLTLLNAASTLVVVISKTFTTQETRLNAEAVKRWMVRECGAQSIARQWFAVSSNVAKAQEFGIDESHVLPMWDWVGGRFSIWSAVALPLALAIGNDNFSAFKRGAYRMDEHFKQAEFRHNMPVLLALLGIWNRNYLQYPSLAILPYAHSLRALPGYLQQTDMESNGKSVQINGVTVSMATAPVVFGQEGTNGQHAFMQLMHQSQDIIPTDFIVAVNGHSDYVENHRVLVANGLAQAEALMCGKSLLQVQQELREQGMPEPEIQQLAPHKVMKGNTPSNMLLLKAITPETLGALLALYEHKIFVQGIVWQINSFDQWGVELGKQLGQQILAAMTAEQQNTNLSASTSELLSRCKLGDG